MSDPRCGDGILDERCNQPCDQTMRCPTCKQTIPSDQRKFWPFCSERCKLIDLGKWLDGSYTIPAEPACDAELAADAQAGEQSEPKPH